jgi:UDP-N-acetyl-2-amino-2-deoxyglucuronate dehydrogenase
MRATAHQGRRFALIGAAGFVARRHLEAIRAIGGDLVAAHDVSDSVGILDGFFPQAEFFLHAADFSDYLMRHVTDVDYLVICTPSDLHEEHCELAARLGIRVVVEKPPALSTAGIDRLIALEGRTGIYIHPILQLRYHADLIEFRRTVLAHQRDRHLDIHASYIARRGPWYSKSWKGDDKRSGTIIYTFGIHLFDTLVWTFGQHRRVSAEMSDDGTQAKGSVDFDTATVHWMLSSRGADLPPECPHSASRQFRIGGEVAADYSGNYAGLHSAYYRKLADGLAPRISDARPATELSDAVLRATERTGTGGRTTRLCS